MDYATQAAALYRSQSKIANEAHRWWLRSPYNLTRVGYEGDDTPPTQQTDDENNYGEEF